MLKDIRNIKILIKNVREMLWLLIDVIKIDMNDGF